jgi:hypothetical protein
MEFPLEDQYRLNGYPELFSDCLSDVNSKDMTARQRARVNIKQGLLSLFKNDEPQICEILAISSFYEFDNFCEENVSLRSYVPDGTILKLKELVIDLNRNINRSNLSSEPSAPVESTRKKVKNTASVTATPEQPDATEEKPKTVDESTAAQSKPRTLHDLMIDHSHDNPEALMASLFLVLIISRLPEHLRKFAEQRPDIIIDIATDVTVADGINKRKLSIAAMVERFNEVFDDAFNEENKHKYINAIADRSLSEQDRRSMAMNLRDIYTALSKEAAPIEDARRENEFLIALEKAIGIEPTTELLLGSHTHDDIMDNFLSHISTGHENTAYITSQFKTSDEELSQIVLREMKNARSLSIPEVSKKIREKYKKVSDLQEGRIDKISLSLYNAFTDYIKTGQVARLSKMLKLAAEFRSTVVNATRSVELSDVRII